MQSKQISVNQNEICRLHGNEGRRQFSLQVEGNKAYRFALCPIGTLDPTPYWITIAATQGNPANFQHIGEVYVEATTPGTHIIYLASDKEIETTFNYVVPT